MDGPEVTIVVATYNRSNVLKLAIESARAQSFQDWEMLVVGDACTDDSGQVVASFGDDRVQWFNLTTNHGDQAGPNNAGVERARGRLIAFLNHDDLWFPDHLERCVGHLKATDAAGVFSPAASVAPDGEVRMAPSWTGSYLPNRVMAVASAWVLRREVIDRVGPWRGRHAIRDIPSRDWLTRALRHGETIEQVPYLTVLHPPAGRRPGSYLNQDDAEHRALWKQMTTDPGFREELLGRIALRESAERQRPRPLGHALQAGKDAVVVSFGDRWIPVRNAVRYRRKGGLMENLRRTKGANHA
jgi:glycosyltransferase involved in cell wall biosynthesis